MEPAILPPSTNGGLPQTLVAAVLPSSRSVRLGTAATAYATIINTGPQTATGCGIAPLTGLQDGITFQTTDPATNKLTGAPNTRVDIPSGAVQTFVLSVTPTVALNPTDVQLSFACSNTAPASVTSGLDTLLLSASPASIPDIVALAATLSNDGIVTIPTGGSGAFAVATVNVGGSGPITATVDTGITSLPVTATLCQTDPVSGNCISAVGTTVTTTINASATPTFAAFVSSGSVVPFNPAANRVFVRFNDASGVTRGATSVAVKTQGAPASVCTMAGTAASGISIAGAPVIAKDLNGSTLTTTTDSSGKYSLDVTSLAAPMLLKVDGGAGKVFFSVGGQTCSGLVVANLHPLTDVITRTWYDVQGQTADAAFANPAVASVPTTDAIQTVSKVVSKTVETVLAANGVDLNTFDPIATPFVANGSGFDKVLDSLTVDTTARTIAVNDTANSLTQRTVLTVDTGASTVSGATAVGIGTNVPVCGGANVTCNVASTVVTTTLAQVTALTGVSTTLTNLAGVVNSKGAALATSDLLAFFDAKYLNDGDDRNADAQRLVDSFRGATLNSFTIQQISSFDPAHGLIRVTGAGSTTLNGVTSGIALDFFTFKQETDGRWLLFGNQSFAGVVARLSFDHSPPRPGCVGPCSEFNDALTLQAIAPVGTIASASVKGSDNTQVTLIKDPAIYVGATGVLTEHFTLSIVPRPSTAVPGVAETFTVTRASDGFTQTSSVILNALTTESIDIVGPSGHTLADARLGQPLTLSWTLPKTFVIQSIVVSGSVSVANAQGQTFFCNVGVNVLPTATSGTLTLPATCNGLPIGANLTSSGPIPALVAVTIVGVNGEQTAAEWIFE